MQSAETQPKQVDSKKVLTNVRALEFKISLARARDAEFKCYTGVQTAEQTKLLEEHTSSLQAMLVQVDELLSEQTQQTPTQEAERSSLMPESQALIMAPISTPLTLYPSSDGG